MSILGWIAGFALMVVGIILSKNQDTKDYVVTLKNLENFLDPTSIAIVFGGTFAALMIAFPHYQLSKIPKHLKIILAPQRHDPFLYIEKLVECAKKARVNGLLALEEDVDQMDDAFLKSAVMMVVDSVDPEKVKQQLDAWMDNLDERHAQERAFYDKGASFAPAFGMIGTLIGLINMLQNMKDVESVGPNMAVALVTTFYGTILANLFFIPVSNKLRVRHEEEYLCMSIICEGVQAIQAGENPKFIQDRLVHLLPEYQQRAYENDAAAKEETQGARVTGRRSRRNAE